MRPDRTVQICTFLYCCGGRGSVAGWRDGIRRPPPGRSVADPHSASAAPVRAGMRSLYSNVDLARPWATECDSWGLGAESVRRVQHVESGSQVSAAFENRWLIRLPVPWGWGPAPARYHAIRI